MGVGEDIGDINRRIVWCRYNAVRFRLPLTSLTLFSEQLFTDLLRNVIVVP